MSSLWSNPASPFAAQGAAPTPGGGAAARFQSILQSAGQSKLPAAQSGLSPAGSRAAAASGASSPAGSSDSDATISANDFLTLLVTEMQNQDPTADVDPNAYIDQLVQINSLEQLISINQNLETVLGAATSPAPSAAGSPAVLPPGRAIGPAAPAVGARGSQTSATAAVSAARGKTQPAAVQGNLGAPGAAPAAKTVANALDGRARRGGHAIRDIPTHSLP